ANCEGFTATNANHLVTNARILATVPSLLVNCYVAFPSDLPVSESIVPKFFWQRLIEMTFPTPSLRRSARFLRGDGYWTANKIPQRFFLLMLASGRLSRLMLVSLPLWLWIVGLCQTENPLQF